MTFEVANGATFKMTSTTGMVTGFTTKSFGTTSTVDYAGAAQTVSNEAYGNLSLSGSGTKTMPGTAMTTAGDFTMSGTASATAGAAINVGGDWTIGTGTTFNASSFSHTLKGDWSRTGTFTQGTSTLTLNGTSAQSLTGATTFNNLTLNNSAGASLANDQTVNGTLTLTSGIVTTGANTVVIPTGGSVSRTASSTSNFVNGNLRKAVATGSNVARTFETGVVGGSSQYTPVDLTFASVTGAGNVTVSAANGDHAGHHGEHIRDQSVQERQRLLDDHQRRDDVHDRQLHLQLHGVASRRGSRHDEVHRPQENVGHVVEPDRQQDLLEHTGDRDQHARRVRGRRVPERKSDGADGPRAVQEQRHDVDLNRWLHERDDRRAQGNCLGSGLRRHGEAPGRGAPGCHRVHERFDQ